jgi:hypothetical protein
MADMPKPDPIRLPLVPPGSHRTIMKIIGQTDPMDSVFWEGPDENAADLVCGACGSTLITGIGRIRLKSKHALECAICRRLNDPTPS